MCISYLKEENIYTHKPLQQYCRNNKNGIIYINTDGSVEYQTMGINRLPKITGTSKIYQYIISEHEIIKKIK